MRSLQKEVHKKGGPDSTPEVPVRKRAPICVSDKGVPSQIGTEGELETAHVRRTQKCQTLVSHAVPIICVVLSLW